jgi:hypothetical protein
MLHAWGNEEIHQNENIIIIIIIIYLLQLGLQWENLKEIYHLDDLGCGLE